MSALLDAIRKPSVTNQPPTSREIMRSDLATVALIIAALLLGLAVRNTTLSASKKVELEGMPPLAIPAHWMPGTADNLDFYARSAGSPSIFDTEMAVYTRRLRNEETLISARAAWGVRRSQDLERYRELSAEPVTVLDGQPAALVTYAYVADPTRLAGAGSPPVVVQGQDLLFVYEDQLVVVSVAADVTAWDSAQKEIDIIFGSLRLQEVEQ